ncbi:MAG: two-component system, NtrC family, sensor histidine kinase HydH [Acidobacteriota bacterium]|jgi:signal transduction histidine kinase|nr:two-component system, NtrC family, sensor histidine kinase HydH [Acidobacteriota bacterium]
MNKQSLNHPDINKVLSDITSALVGHFEMNSLLDQVVNTSMRTLNAEVCSIFLEDREKEPGFITMMAGSGFARSLVGKAKYKIGEGFTGYVAKSGQVFNIRTRGQLESLEIDGMKIWQGRYDSSQWPSGQSEFRSLVAVPLRIKDQILGVIKIENKNENAGPYFTDEDQRYFETIANVVALAIENVRLHLRVETQLKAIAAKASHRIGNQVTNYDGVELYLKDEIRRPVPDKQALDGIRERIATTTKNLKRMIEEFQNYGKPLHLEIRAADINEIITNEAWLARPPAEIQILQSLAPGLPKALIDPGRFAEAIKELFRNALKTMHNEGVSSHTNPTEGLIYVTTGTSGTEGIIIRIEDNGPGFPPDFPIFEPFQTMNPNSTGLGLATVKELVEAHKGKIKALKSTELGGACIEIEIPVAR